MTEDDGRAPFRASNGRLPALILWVPSFVNNWSTSAFSASTQLGPLTLYKYCVSIDVLSLFFLSEA